MDILVTSIDRSGTTSLAYLFGAIFKANDHPGEALHETDEDAILLGAIDTVARGDDSRVESVLRSWTHAGESATALMFNMATVRRVFGPDLAIIHVKREREAWCRSWIDQAHSLPAYYLGYGPDDFGDAVHRQRVTAVHFGEMDQAAWDALSLEARALWFYDKAHSAIEAELPHFNRVMSLDTSALNDPETVGRIVRFINPGFTAVPRPVFVNQASVVPDSITDPLHKRLIQNYFHRFDWHLAASHLDYPVRHATSYLMTAANDVYGEEKAREMADHFSRQIMAWVQRDRG